MFHLHFEASPALTNTSLRRDYLTGGGHKILNRSSALGPWGCRGASGCCTGGFAKLVAGNVENGKAPTLLWKRLEIRLDKNLNRLFAASLE